MKQHHTKNRMSAAASIVESSLDKVSWSYAEFRYSFEVRNRTGSSLPPHFCATIIWVSGKWSILISKNPDLYHIYIAKFSITRTWLWSRYWNNHYRYKHATWYVERGRDDTSLNVLIFLKFKKFNDFFVRQRKKSPNILDKICKRYGKIRSLNCGENLSSDHTMTIPKWVWGLILPLVRSNDR